MNKSESRYFSTAVKMDRAFLELLDKKDLPFITVKEICERAESTALPFIFITKISATFWRKAPSR